MVKPDGTVCTGCESLGMFKKRCKKGHQIEHLNGCSNCGKPVRYEVYMKLIGVDEIGMEKCTDYTPDPDYWQKDVYG